jgi:hypothetical protein
VIDGEISDYNAERQEVPKGAARESNPLLSRRQAPPILAGSKPGLLPKSK